MSNFQLVVTSIFVGFILVGVGVFALFGGVFGGGGAGPVVVWGTQPQESVDYLLESLRSQDKSLQDVTYVQKDSATYEADLVNAMASGASPDLILINQEQLGTFTDKIIPIPYGSYSQAQFVSSFVDEGQLFLTQQGSLALPFMMDPLVMYWNRDIFGSAGVAQAPMYWNDFLNLAPKMTSLDASQNVKRSAVALGAWQNVANAKAILSTLFMQAGDFITARSQSGALVATFGGSAGGGSTAAESALRFYTEFANPSKTTYSWNRSLPNSTNAFAGGQLAVYFGFASEYADLTARNPNLRFAIATVPQLQGGGTRITYGRLTGLAIPRAARNAAGAAIVAGKLTSAAAANILMTQTGLPPARRDVSLATASNAAAEAVQQSALMARGWVDPNKPATDELFKGMIESVVSGRSEPSSAVSEAAAALAQLLPVHY